LTATNASENRLFTINGTLIVYGNLDFGNKAADLVLGNGALLIVFGNIIVDNKMDISSTGNIIATGSFTKSGAEDQGSYTGTGNVYASPITVPGVWVPLVDQKNNTTDLNNDLPNVYNFINCGGGPSCSLPIKLGEFRGIVSENNTVVLHWTTIMEENFSKFVLQRSSTGTTFHDLAEIAASGRDKFNIKTSYAFEDVLPLAGFNYYRLKAVDLDGAFEIFDPICIRLDAGAKVSVYPNPMTGSEIEIHLNFSPGENDRLKIFNQYGAEVLENSVTEFNTALSFEKNLPTGIYYLRYSSSTFNSTVRLVVK
jgi:hypothetical protein